MMGMLAQKILALLLVANSLPSLAMIRMLALPIFVTVKRDVTIPISHAMMAMRVPPTRAIQQQAVRILPSLVAMEMSARSIPATMQQDACTPM
jgi:hypothetical protein